MASNIPEVAGAAGGPGSFPSGSSNGSGSSSSCGISIANDSSSTSNSTSSTATSSTTTTTTTTTTTAATGTSSSAGGARSAAVQERPPLRKRVSFEEKRLCMLKPMARPPATAGGSGRAAAAGDKGKGKGHGQDEHPGLGAAVEGGCGAKGVEEGEGEEEEEEESGDLGMLQPGLQIHMPFPRSASESTWDRRRVSVLGALHGTPRGGDPGRAGGFSKASLAAALDSLELELKQ